MSRLYGPAFQFAFVVEDIDAAIRHWTDTLGVGPFFMFPLPLGLARESPVEYLELID